MSTFSAFIKERSQSLWADRYELLRKLLITVGVSVSVKNFQTEGLPIFQTIVKYLGLHGAMLAIGTGAALAGYGAYRFKCWRKDLYGFSEVIFGIASGYTLAFSLSQHTNNLPQWVSLVGCSYVIQRGLNNMREARKDKGVAGAS